MTEAAPVTCLRCGMQDPPPEPACNRGRDHRVGTEQGCAGCGRLAEACSRRPCSLRRRAEWRRSLRGTGDSDD